MIQFCETRDISHEGDERSRTHPGHGYPAYTETLITLQQFVTNDRLEWETAIQTLLLTRKVSDFTAFKCLRPKLTTTVNVDLAFD